MHDNEDCRQVTRGAECEVLQQNKTGEWAGS